MRTRWLGVLLVLFTLVISGLAESASKRLVWATCCNQLDRHELFQDLAKEYESTHPDVDIEWVYPTGGGYYDILLTWIAGGTPADVMWLGLGFPRFVDLVMPLNDLIEDGEVDPIHPGMLDMFQWQGRQLALPFGTSTHTFGYNKTLFDEAGLSYPTAVWTWDELIQLARLLTADENGDGNPDRWGVRIDNVMHALNYGPGFYDEEGRQARFANPITIAAVQLYADIYSGKNGVSPAPSSTTRIQDFIDQRVAMTNVGIYDMPVIQTTAQFDWDLVTFPYLVVDGERYRSTDMSGEAWSIYKDTKYPQAARDFVTFLLSKDVMLGIVEAGIVVPSQQSVTGPYLSADPPPSNLVATIDSMDFGEMLPYAHPIGAEITSMLSEQESWSQLWKGEAPAASLLPQWEGQVNQLLKEYWDRVE